MTKQFLLSKTYKVLELHDQWPGNTVKFVDGDGPETFDKGDDFHLPVERVGVVFKVDGYIAEVLIAPFLLNDGMSHSCFISNAV